MNRTTLVLGILSALAAVTVACGEPPNTLSNETPNGTIAGGGEESDDDDSSDATKDAPVTTTSASATEPKDEKTTKPAEPAGACDPEAAKTAGECAKCCAEQVAPTTKPAEAGDCACGAGGACTDACGETAVCGGNGISFQCGICLFEKKCTPGGIGNIGNAGGDVNACLQTCESKPVE